MIQQTLTANELNAMVASMQSRDKMNRGIMKQQLETLAARMNDGDITITDKLMDLVAKHNVSCGLSWSWTNNAGKDVAGGIGALATFLSSGVDSPSNHPVHHTRLSIDGRNWRVRGSNYYGG